jgi:hypothetical protein
VVELEQQLASAQQQVAQLQQELESSKQDADRTMTELRAQRAEERNTLASAQAELSQVRGMCCASLFLLSEVPTVLRQLPYVLFYVVRWIVQTLDEHLCVDSVSLLVMALAEFGQRLLELSTCLPVGHQCLFPCHNRLSRPASWDTPC